MAWKTADTRRVQQLLASMHRQMRPDRSEAHGRRLAARLAEVLKEGNALVVIASEEMDPERGWVRHLRELGWTAVRLDEEK